MGWFLAMALVSTSAFGALIPAAMTGTRSTGTGGVTADGWNPYEISWEITQVGNLYKYEYTFTSGRPEVSHFILQVSDTFTEKNIFAGTDPTPDLATQKQGAGNPNMLSDLYGIKWDAAAGNDIATGSLTLFTDRAPVWGSFYTKGGNDSYAYNSGWPTGTTPPAGTTDFNGWIATPDTNGFGGVVPEPASMAIFGALSGLIGYSGWARRRRR
jgi:hypothetical protein